MAKRLNKLDFCNIPLVLRSTNTIVRAGEFKFEALKRVSNERAVDPGQVGRGRSPNCPLHPRSPIKSKPDLRHSNRYETWEGGKTA